MQLQVTGLDKLIRTFDRAKVSIDEELTEAMARSTTIIQQTAREKAPVKTGTLRRTITKDVEYGGRVGKVIVGQPYGKYVEFGRGPVYAKAGKVLRFKINGVWVFAKSVGPAKAQPFMRPAFENNLENLRKYFNEARNKIIGKLV